MKSSMVDHTRGRLWMAVIAAAISAPASAHHEAIFGPQSSMMLTAPAFVSLQSFHKASAGRASQTTTLVSAGFAPSPHSGMSAAVIVPFSVDGSGRAGIENIVAGGRYRLALRGLEERLGKDGNFLLFMGAVEIPNGTFDRTAFSGAVNWLAAALYSVEWRSLSAIGYVFYRLDVDGLGDRLYAGIGLAYTPYERNGRLVSLQLGASHETLFAERRPEPRKDTGWQLMINPTLMFAPHPHWSLFVTASVAAIHRMPTLDDADQWRLGGGILYVIGGHD